MGWSTGGYPAAAWSAGGVRGGGAAMGLPGRPGGGGSGYPPPGPAGYGGYAPPPPQGGYYAPYTQGVQAPYPQAYPQASYPPNATPQFNPQLVPQHHAPPQPQQYQQQQYPPYPLPSVGPRMTAEGYTISSSYVAPPPLPPSHIISTRGGSTRVRGNSNRGGRTSTSDRPAPAPVEPPTPISLSCSLPGCPITVTSKKLLREHEEDRHLIFEKGREPTASLTASGASDG